MPFVEVSVTTNEQAIREELVAKLKAEMEAKGFLGWEANEADLAIILLSTMASMGPPIAEIFATVPPAIFRAFGTELVKIPYNEGAAATVTTKWTLSEEGGKYPPHTIEAGTQLTIGEFAFLVQANTSVLEGESTKNVVLVAVERGTEFNNLTGTVELVDVISWVKEVTIIGETSGGVNQESDEEYENRLANAMKLRAEVPVTAANFAEAALQVPSSVIPSGVVVGRTTAIDGFNPSTINIEGKPTIAKTDLKEVSTFVGVSVESTSPQKHPGSILKWKAGAGVLAKGTTMKAKLGAAEGELSIAAEKTEAKGLIEVIGKYEEQRTVTVFVTDKKGKALTSEAMTKIEEWLKEKVELNFLVFVREASYNEVQVKTKVHVLPGYTESTVTAAVKAAIEKFLSPETWGNPTAAETGISSWLNATQGANLVRYNQVLGAIEAVPGVQYVFAGSAGLSIGLGEAPGSKTSDLTMEGPAPLPECKPANVTVTAE